MFVLARVRKSKSKGRPSGDMSVLIKTIQKKVIRVVQTTPYSIPEKVHIKFFNHDNYIGGVYLPPAVSAIYGDDSCYPFEDMETSISNFKMMARA